VNDFRISFYCFLALATLLPWALGLALWRRIGRRPQAVSVVVTSTAALAFVLGALWWNVVDPAVWPRQPDPEPNPDGTRAWGLYVLAGVASVACLTIGTVVLLVAGAICERAAPGTLAPLMARVRPAKRDGDRPS
jgi:hypothetical protein